MTSMILRRPAPGSAPRYSAVEPPQPGLRFANLFLATASSLIFLKNQQHPAPRDG